MKQTSFLLLAAKLAPLKMKELTLQTNTISVYNVSKITIFMGGL